MSFNSTISHNLDNLLANFITIFPRFDLNYSTYVHYKKKSKKKNWKVPQTIKYATATTL